jgi:hypothetical protein
MLLGLQFQCYKIFEDHHDVGQFGKLKYAKLVLECGEASQAQIGMEQLSNCHPSWVVALLFFP